MPDRPPIEPALLERCIAPLAEARTLPADAYLSPDVFAWENARVFEGSWTCVGRSSDLSQPGDQRAVRIGSDGVLLVRGKDGRLGGFFNTCRHRGHELLPCGAEPVRRGFIRCPYHSWTYALDGTFRTAPGFADRPTFEPADPEHGLASVRVEEWSGWVFANCSGEAPDLKAHVGNLDQAMEPYEPERLVVEAVVDYDVHADWKVISENYHECYHCENIHPELCRVTPPDSGVQFVPTGLVVGGSLDLMEHAETMSLSGESRGVPFRRLDERRRREVHYLQVLPNLFISAHPDYVLTHLLEPLGPGRTRVRCEWLFPPEAWEREGFDPGYAVEFWDITNRQDWSACEAAQRGAAGRGYRQAPLSSDEVGVYQFMALIAQSYLAGNLTGPVPAGRLVPARG
ncbi:MAG TPA: aromatic ring-hydroxylating dioxygenase subunit alpha [Actinomycetota bacterium]|jgi:Rieske 2Fe-2S family protein|nr:aromatic ring-hydroxylating dioxygenase subunit alpha [Actinomycetota bacterium]